jgi:hypothetical protein
VTVPVFATLQKLTDFTARLRKTRNELERLELQTRRGTGKPQFFYCRDWPPYEGPIQELPFHAYIILLWSSGVGR